MIEALIILIKASIGTEIGNRVYANVVPELAVYPCLVFERTYTDPFQSKDIQSRTNTRVDIKIYDKGDDGSISAFQSVETLTDQLIFDLNGVNDGESEYRFEQTQSGYSKDLNAHYSITEIVINHL